MASRRLAQLPHLCEVMHVESSLAAWPTFQGPGPFYVGGAMSGTSLDGLDLALVKFWHQDGRWRHELVQSTCLPYDQSPWAHRLPASYSLRGAALDEVSREYSQWLNAEGTTPNYASYDEAKKDADAELTRELEAGYLEWAETREDI